MEKEFNSDDSGRNTPREVVLTRSDTPGPTPAYIYSRDQLYEFANSKTAKKRPVCLSTDYDNTEGLWDPEKWFRSFDSGAGDRLSPLNVGEKEKKTEYLNKRRPSDPKERLKEEKDGIVLSPQRRSFGTGCHVTAPTMTRQVSCPADYKDDNRNVRRIGSGRIQIDRDRGERDREPQHAQREREPQRERDYRAIRDRFDDGRDRRYDNRGDNRGYRREYDDRRDFSRHFSRDNGRNRHDSYRHREEEEPEWFSEGPTSQNDRIELHGFEGPREVKEEHVKGKDDEEDDNNMDTGFDEEYHEEAQQDESNKSSEVKVADVKERNGSLETNESSSPEESNNSGSLHVQSPQATNLFDFNEFFKIENLPGLNEGGSPTAEVQAGFQSRFSRWFSSHHGGGSMGNSRENSRRSSINEDFGYLNELLSGTKSPIVPSPPPNTINSMYDKSVFMTPGNSTFSDKPQCISVDMSVSQKNIIAPMLNSIFQNSGSSHHKRNDSNSSNYSVQDVEAQLKALLFGRKDSTASSSGNNSPAVSSPRNVPYIKTVQELEADMKPTTTPGGHNYPQQPIPHPLAMNHHKIERQNRMTPPGARMTPPGVRMTPPTVIHHHQPHQQQHQQHQQPSSQQSSRRSSEDEGDLTAFNKLLSLMQAGAAAAVESPKIPTRQETRVPSPPQQMMQARPQTPNSQQTQAQIAQNEFLQALLRNKEQQNLIRQQALMKMNYMTKQSTPLAQPTPLGQQTPGGLRTTLPESLANYIKQNPTIITKSASPTPPPQTVLQQPQAPTMMNIIQNTSTPRAPSPTPQQVIPNFMPQPTSSPRVPSPIMFSQQPPMHLNAPSPIHPSQLTSTSPINVPAVSMSSTASIRPPVIHRGPSPQELIAHTQAIMQTALLKKQLEDQKERFMKKQQERAKSPNPTGTPIPSKSPSMMPMPMSNNPVIVNNQPKPAVSVAFTPTSVMRKMHSDKASEKDKQKPEMGEGTPVPPPPIRQLIRPDGSLNDEDHNSPNNEIDRHLNNKYQESRNGPQSDQQFNTHVPPPGYSMGSSTGNIEQGTGANKNSRPGPNMMSNMMQANGPLPQMSGPPPLLSTQLSTPGRPIVKAVNVSTSSVTGVMTPNQVPMRQFSVSQQLNTPLSSASIQQRAIMGQNTLQTASPNMPPRPMNISPNPLTRPIVGTPVSQNFSMGIPITGRMPIPQGGVNMSPSPLVLQQMMQGGISPATARVNALNQINQINHLNQMALQAQQQQQRMMDPRLQGIRGIYPPSTMSPRTSLQSAGLNIPNSMGVNVAMSRALSPHALSQKQSMGGPVSPGLYNGNNNLTKTGEPNLFKWFGNDVLKGQIPNMPPLPQQGTRVMTVDEIERC
ncbi:uncharacterized protein LOC143076653 isoform X1 [Mytilus galloprovincialis]|uniref:uncharacterized protein LOC143076653 isoform X1 n=1 Tax=Mytilus galloprovincialis TaxID=29158 RepID=UPI003F7C3A51